MAERRNRRSSLDTEEETKRPSRMSERNSWKEKEHQPRHRTGRYDEFFASGTTGASDPTDNFGWDLIDEKPIAPKNDSFIKSRLSAPEGREIGGRNRYNRNVSPGFDGIERHNYNHSLENDRTHPHRYVERGGTRSRSRSRTRGRSRSRSLSRGREREGERVRERSRSRSRGDRSARDRASPRGDYRPQSYERSERRTEPGKSSKICRDFTAGRCMRGSQCRFIHPDDTNRRDRNLVEDRSKESWRNRSDHENRTSTHSYGRGHGFEPRDDVYHGDTEQFHSKARSEIPCNNFLKGKCDWGDSCKFSHHFASDDNNSFGKGNRNTSFDRDIERQAKNEKPLCKYFVAGNCDRGDNCRFSHENPKVTNLEGRRCEFTDDHILHDKGNTWNDRGDNYRFSQENPRSSNLEGRRGEFTDDHSLRDKGNKTWNGPTWDEEARNPDIVPRENPKSTNLEGRRGEFTDDHNLRVKGNNTWNDPTWDEEAKNPDIVPRENPKSTNLEGRRVEFIDDHNLRDTGNNTWNSPTWDDEARNPDMVPRGWNEPIGMDMTTTVDTISRRSDDKSWGEWTDNSLNREKKPSPLKEIGSYGTTDSFGKDTMSNEQERLTLHPSQFNQAGISSQGQNRIHENHTFSVTPLLHNVSPALHFQPQQPNETDRGMNMPISNRSEGFSIDLNGPGTEMADPTQLQNHQEAVQQPIISKLNAPRNFPYSLTSEQSSEMTNYPVTISNPQVAPLANSNVGLTNSFVNEESQTYAGIEVMSPWGTMSSNPINTQPDPPIVSFDRSNPMESSGDANEHWNNILTRGLEPNNQMHVKQSSALPIVGKEFDNSKVEHPRSPKLKQDDMVVDSVGNGGKNAINDESKGPEEKKVPETVESHGKIEENDANKDEKGMRLFKNSLIEFVKELLKPKWKEGKMSREVHKTIVKKVVEKVTTTIQADHVPKTQDKVEMYLSSSKPKLLKLVQAYVERCQKKDT